MFIRIMQAGQRRELLLNVNHITKIEVRYAIPKADGDLVVTSLQVGVTNPSTVRTYKVYFGEESYLFASEPGNPIMRVFEDIYKHSVKGEDTDETGDGPG